VEQVGKYFSAQWQKGGQSEIIKGICLFAYHNRNIQPNACNFVVSYLNGFMPKA
jgi:hypothetical protein